MANILRKGFGQGMTVIEAGLKPPGIPKRIIRVYGQRATVRAHLDVHDFALEQRLDGLREAR